MKKNIMMRVAGGVLVATLLTTSIISGTFAKYVTSDSVADQARVAKFGVVVTGSGSLFDITYYAANANTPTGGLTQNNEEDKLQFSVESYNDYDKLVAPGTENTDGMTIAITGKPEVDVHVEIKVEALEQIFLKAAAEGLPNMTTGTPGDDFGMGMDYYPIVWTLTRQIEGSGDEVLTTWDWTAIKAKFESVNGDYDANTNLAAVVGTFTLTWKWQYEDTSSDAMKALQDKEDTLLGDLAAYVAGELDADPADMEALGTLEKGTTGDYNLNVNIQFSATVTQID